MLSFHDTSLVVFDVEVSDVDEARINGTVPEIIDIGAIKISSDLSVIQEFSSLVRPRELSFVTDHTTELTGITEAMVKTAKPWKFLWEDFVEFTGNSRLAAFHAHNDFLWLKNAYSREVLGFPHPHFVFDIASWVYGFCSWYGIKPSGWGLSACCKRFDVPYLPIHRGLPDATAALGVLTAIQRIEHEHELQLRG